MKLFEIPLVWVKSVSYTHLDVYKRQELQQVKKAKASLLKEREVEKEKLENQEKEKKTLGGELTFNLWTGVAVVVLAGMLFQIFRPMPAFDKKKGEAAGKLEAEGGVA